MIININSEKIALSMYEMMIDSGDAECLKVDMLPKNFMDMLDRCLVNKLEEIFAFEKTMILENLSDVPDLFEECMEELNVKIADQKQKITHEIVCKIISLATKTGLCIV